jgi:DNA-binding transcriptional regulator YiaG
MAFARSSVVSTGESRRFRPSRTLREKTGLSQSEFARLLGVSIRTLQEWEQGRRAPSGAARTLILIAAKNPATPAEVGRVDDKVPGSNVVVRAAKLNRPGLI